MVRNVEIDAREAGQRMKFRAAAMLAPHADRHQQQSQNQDGGENQIIDDAKIWRRPLRKIIDDKRKIMATKLNAAMAAPTMLMILK
jgi:hypothetical protein